MSNYGISGKKIFNKDDGVIINLEEVKKLKVQNAIEEFSNAMEELQELGVEPNVIIVKYRNKNYSCIDIKRDFEFNKEFRCELRELMLTKQLSKNSRCFIGTLAPFISFPTNAIHIKYQNPTMNELMDILDMSKNTLFETLKELENNNIIIRQKLDGQTIIYFNPFLYCGGYCIDKHTYDLFKSSEYNPIN